MRANRTKRLGQDHTGSTVQQAIGLVRPMIDWESSLNLLSIYFEYLQSDGIGNGGQTAQVV